MKFNPLEKEITMRRYAAAFLILAATALPALAGDNHVLRCLDVTDSKTCLVDAAQSRLAAVQDVSTKTEGYEALLSALRKANLRRDDVFEESGKSLSGPLVKQWQLMVARYGYVLKYRPEDASPDELSKIDALAHVLISRLDGPDLVLMVASACEAREGMSPEVVVRWGELINRLCLLSPDEKAKMESSMPGLSLIVAPLIDSYRRDEVAFRVSLLASVRFLSKYESVLADKRTPKMERDEMRKFIYLGHLLNATAVAMSGRDTANVVVNIARKYLKKVPSVADNPAFPMYMAQMSWVLAKSGLKAEARSQVRETLSRVDRQTKNMSTSVQISSIATCIETLSVLDRDFNPSIPL